MIISCVLDLEDTRLEAQVTLHSYCHVSRLWYSLAIGLLYQAPVLGDNNYMLFIRAICAGEYGYILSDCSKYDEEMAEHWGFGDAKSPFARLSQNEKTPLPYSYQDNKSPFSKYVKVLDLTTWPYGACDTLVEDLLQEVYGGLEFFVAPAAYNL
jgi:hypothetical protein